MMNNNFSDSNQNVHLWDQLSGPERDYFYHRISKKLTMEQRIEAEPLYARYGWDCVFHKD